ncbi:MULTISPECIES: CPBP family intramembrane glutamic endopeptidase [Priestia]|jgi:hypothetical protein|uniref:CPBP family intramembrane glutamic endopeptidase n=1 Tax=Priestia TaxID=2800373 RepID=UPI0018678AA9|nr:MULTISPECIES: CPBP family intramembrane glutamic endopeptidase [Priestia]MBE2974014.1 CPBP family intramembrane metalloprotease [Priestia megaterium]MBY0089695.1 CPBP family intramembrane metalloprotease [Priestia aryabhattai]MBY0100716.1 CPBP family intramembrane metalloprotease [Priestia aryabhattai]MCM3303858.1 CPBP family intramembrane metalloprotease [Priestia megaterium]
MKPKAEKWCSDDQVKAFVESYWPRNLSYLLVFGKRCIREHDASYYTLSSVFRNRPFGDWNSILSNKNKKVAVLLSSFLFAFTHSLNMLSGQSVANTIFQILFAFVIGLVLALLIVNGQSIGVTIVFHGLNNFLQFTSPVKANDSLLINYALLLFLSGYAFYLWNRKSTLSVSHNQVSG